MKISEIAKHSWQEIKIAVMGLIEKFYNELHY